MNRLLLVVVVPRSSLIWTISGGAINPGTQSAAGTVTIVQFSASGGTGVSLTIITLTGNSTANTLNFCGDQRTLFPVDKQVQINFTPGQPCATVLTVTLF